jgi:chromosome partitioning protein
MTDAETGPDRARSIFESLRASNIFAKPADPETGAEATHSNPGEPDPSAGSTATSPLLAEEPQRHEPQETATLATWSSGLEDSTSAEEPPSDPVYLGEAVETPTANTANTANTDSQDTAGGQPGQITSEPHGGSRPVGLEHAGQPNPAAGKDTADGDGAPGGAAGAAEAAFPDPTPSANQQRAEAPGADTDVAPGTLDSEGRIEQAASSAERAAAEPEGEWGYAFRLTTPHPAALAHPLPRILAVANQKGGVGKTTTTVNLGAALAELGYRVLVVDLDPQGNATTGLGVNARNLDSSVYDVILHDVPIEDVIEPTTLRNLFVVPATIDLAGAEIELVPVFSRELRLRRALEPAEPDFDFTLVDCPPSLGLLTVNALAAAGEVLVPIQCEYYALEGLGQLLRNVGLVQGNLNSRLDVSTIVLTMYDARTKLAEQVADDVRDHFGDRVCRSVVPRSVRLSEAPSFGQPIITFDPSSRGAIAYRALAKEVSGGAPPHAA